MICKGEILNKLNLNYMIIGIFVISMAMITMYLSINSASASEDRSNFRIRYCDYSTNSEAQNIEIHINDSVFIISDSLNLTLPSGLHHILIKSPQNLRQKLDSILIEDPNDKYVYSINYKYSEIFRREAIDFFYQRELDRHDTLDTLSRKIIFDNVAEPRNRLIDSLQRIEVFHTFFINKSKVILS